MKLYYLFSILFLGFNFINCSLKDECNIINSLLKIKDTNAENYCCNYDGIECSSNDSNGHITEM